MGDVQNFRAPPPKELQLALGYLTSHPPSGERNLFDFAHANGSLNGAFVG